MPPAAGGPRRGEPINNSFDVAEYQEADSSCIYAYGFPLPGEKPPLDFAKTFCYGNKWFKYRKMHRSCKTEVFGSTFFQKGGPPEAIKYNHES